MSVYRILLAEDHVLVREAIRKSIEEVPNLAVVGEVGDGLQLMDFVERHPVDLIILDITMPHMQGLEAAKQIKMKHPEIKILILTMHKSKGHVYQAFLAGADGYLLKENAHVDLIAAIERMRRGEQYISTLISGQVADILRQKYSPEPIKTPEQLTGREIEILTLLSTGKSPKEIADILTISAMTVYNHISNIKKRLNIESNYDLMKYAIEKGYTTADLN